MTSLLVPCSPSVSNRIPAQGRQVKQPWQKHEVFMCIGNCPATSILCIHGPMSAALPADLQHLPALCPAATAQPCLKDGEYEASHTLHYISLSLKSPFLIFLLSLPIITCRISQMRSMHTETYLHVEYVSLQEQYCGLSGENNVMSALLSNFLCLLESCFCFWQ